MCQKKTIKIKQNRLAESELQRKIETSPFAAELNKRQPDWKELVQVLNPHFDEIETFLRSDDSLEQNKFLRFFRELKYKNEEEMFAWALNDSGLHIVDIIDHHMKRQEYKEALEQIQHVETVHQFEWMSLLPRKITCLRKLYGCPACITEINEQLNLVAAQMLPLPEKLERFAMLQRISVRLMYKHKCLIPYRILNVLSKTDVTFQFDRVVFYIPHYSGDFSIKIHEICEDLKYSTEKQAMVVGKLLHRWDLSNHTVLPLLEVFIQIHREWNLQSYANA